MDRMSGHAGSGASSEAPPYPLAAKAWFAVGILTIGWTLAYLDRQVIIILVEPLRLDLGLTDTQVSLVQGLAFSIFFVLAGLPIGRLVDRANRRNILLIGILCWSCATVACGLADSFWQLFAARMMVGVGEACLAPAAFSLVADLIRPQRRGLAMGMMIGGTSLGNAGSVLLGGMVLQMFGVNGHVILPLLGEVASWQLVFFVVGAPGILLALLLLTIREPERRERALGGGEARSFSKFVRRHPASFGFGYAAFSFNMVASYSTSIWIPVILMRVHKMPPGQVGLIIGGILLVVGTMGATIGGAMGDWLVRRFPITGRLGVALLIYPLMAALLVGWWFSDSAIYAILAFALSAPLFGNMLNGSSYPALNQMVPNEMRGQTVALYLLVANMAGLGIAPTVVALITDYVLRDPTMVQESVILVAAPAALLGFLSTLLLLKSYRRTCEETAMEAGMGDAGVKA